MKIYHYIGSGKSNCGVEVVVIAADRESAREAIKEELEGFDFDGENREEYLGEYEPDKPTVVMSVNHYDL